MNAGGRFERFENFYSKFTAFRNVDIWLPAGYPDGQEGYPVLYMQDGQNLFDNATAFGGICWGVDRAMARLISESKVRAAIAVGIWNSDVRWRDYMPQKPFWQPALEPHRPDFVESVGGPPLSDAYLRFLVEEVKPFIDSHFHTLAGQPDTFVMGSSMGGLISLYAASEYPHVFGGAACLSTHWPAGGYELVDEMGRRLPDPATHRLYFDYGTETLDAEYEPFQRRMDEHLRAAGYVEHRNWVTRKFDGAEHSERSWRGRVHIPLEFLLK